MKIVFFLTTFLTAFFGHSQSKSDQIVNLSLRVDSLTSVVTNQNNQLLTKSKEIEQLSSALLSSENKNKELEAVNLELNTSITKLEKEINNRVIYTETEEQSDSIPTEYLGFYSAPIGHEGYGDEMNFIFGIDGDNSIVYEEIFAGVHYANYYRVISFDKKSGKVVMRREVRINIDEVGITSAVEDTGIIELNFVKQGNSVFVQAIETIWGDVDMVQVDFVEATILSRKGLPIKLKL